MAEFSELFGDAQTDFVLVSTDTNERLTITRIEVMADNGNQVDVGVVLAFAKPGKVGRIFTGHPGIAAGSGWVSPLREGVIEGDLSENLLLSCEAPTGGAIRVSGSYHKRLFHP